MKEKAKLNARATISKKGKYHTLKLVIECDNRSIDLIVNPVSKSKKTLSKLYFLLENNLPNEQENFYAIQ